MLKDLIYTGNYDLVSDILSSNMPTSLLKQQFTHSERCILLQQYLEICTLISKTL